MLRPAALDPHCFVEPGLADRRVEYDYFRSGSKRGGIAALMYERGKLPHFAQGAAWDAQRIGGKFHPEFVDYATIAIGRSAAAAGISRNEILAIEDYGARDSKYDPDTQIDQTYIYRNGLPPIRRSDTASFGPMALMPLDRCGKTTNEVESLPSSLIDGDSSANSLAHLFRIQPP